MKDELRFDYSDYWVPEKTEPNYVEESSDVTDQDFWELHRFVLECELDTYDDIYSESVGSTIKARLGTVFDKIVEVVLRISEAFKKKSMKKAINWLSKNSVLIGETAKVDDDVRKGLETAMHGYRVIDTFMNRFKKLAEEFSPDISMEELEKELESLSDIVSEEDKTTDSMDRAINMLGMYINLQSGQYDEFYKLAQDLRVKLKKINRIIQRHEVDDSIMSRIGMDTIFQIPKTVLNAFDQMTKGIKAVKAGIAAKAKADTKVKKTQPTTESYYVSFEPEVDILF